MRFLLARLILTGALAAGSCAPALKTAAPVSTPSGVRFEFVRSAAQSVVLAGSFNQWSLSSHPLVKDARGVWTIVVPLPPGEHLFMFVVDGQWESPPAAEDYADDGFGERNGIIVVR